MISIKGILTDTDRETESLKDVETKKQTDSQTNRVVLERKISYFLIQYLFSCTCKTTFKNYFFLEKETDRKLERQKCRKTDRKLERQKCRKTEIKRDKRQKD
jgi:hypothetical protein